MDTPNVGAETLFEVVTDEREAGLILRLEKDHDEQWIAAREHVVRAVRGDGICLCDHALGWLLKQLGERLLAVAKRLSIDLNDVTEGQKLTLIARLLHQQKVRAQPAIAATHAVGLVALLGDHVAKPVDESVHVIAYPLHQHIDVRRLRREPWQAQHDATDEAQDSGGHTYEVIL